MFARMLRSGSTNKSRGGGRFAPTVATAVANSKTIDISAYAWGGIRFTEDPGTVTFYVRADPDDDWQIARERVAKTNITETPGTLPLPLHEELFSWNEMRMVASNSISTDACRLSFKS